jgi:hypothetical protein
MYVYREKDIQELLTDIKALWLTLGRFIYFLRNSKPADTSEWLCSEPHVKAALVNIKAKRAKIV